MPGQVWHLQGDMLLPRRICQVWKSWLNSTGVHVYVTFVNISTRYSSPRAFGTIPTLAPAMDVYGGQFLKCATGDVSLPVRRLILGI